MHMLDEQEYTIPLIEVYKRNPLKESSNFFSIIIGIYNIEVAVFQEIFQDDSEIGGVPIINPEHIALLYEKTGICLNIKETECFTNIVRGNWIYGLDNTNQYVIIKDNEKLIVVLTALGTPPNPYITFIMKITYVPIYIWKEVFDKELEVGQYAIKIKKRHEKPIHEKIGIRINTRMGRFFIGLVREKEK